MLKIEKTVFISYRRTNSFHARAIYQNLQSHGYDVFLDYENIDSGAFDQIILNQIRARAHFIVILTPSALERCTDPNDWLRREIEMALDEKRNIVPLMFDGFNWGNMRQYLVGQMTVLDTYNALDVPANYFEAAMERLRTKFLNIPIDAVLHPTSPTDKVELAKMPQVPYAPVVDTNKLRADEHFEKGNQYHFNGQYDKAIPEYSESLRLNPHNPTALYRRGLGYKETNQYLLALADYDQAIIEADALIRHNPNDAEAYQARGMAYQNGKEDHDRAIADFDEVIRLNPQSAFAYNNRGMAYARKNYDEVVIAWHNDRAYNDRTIADYNDRAIADFDEAIRLNPEGKDAYNNRGFAYSLNKEYDRSIADYTEAIRLNPEDKDADYNRGDAYYNRGCGYALKKEYDRAIADYTEAIRLNPEDKDAYYNRGFVYKDKKEYDLAIADYTEAIRINPQYANAYHDRGLTYSNKGDYDSAIADYTETIRHNAQHENADAYYNRGLAYTNKGEYDLAIADYDRALAINPNDELARENRDIAMRKKRGG